jgi:lipoprotein
MKLFKKVLAAALAGVLALSVLTGCNNSAATVTMVDALNDWSKVYGEGITFEKGNEDLQNQVNALVKIVDEVGKDIKFGDAKDFYEIYDIVMNDPAVLKELGAWAKPFTKANIGDGSPLYRYGFADISLTLSASNKNKNIYYANQLVMNSRDINAPDEEWNRGERNWNYGSEAAVAVATGEINGKKYMVALFKTTAVTNPDYKPNQNPDKN